MARRTLRNLDERILKWTIHYGAIDGISNVSTKRIAKDLRITEPTIYVHFKTKGNLLYEAYKRIVETVYDFQEVPHEDPKQFTDELERELLRLLEKASLKREEVVFAFNYRNSPNYRTFTTPGSELYLQHFSEVLISAIHDPTMTETIKKTLIPVALEIFNLFTFKVAKGEMDATPLRAKILVALVMGGLMNAHEVFYSQLTPEEIATLK
jgi:Transcriptional regulator